MNGEPEACRLRHALYSRLEPKLTMAELGGVRDAADFAQDAHKGQTRDDGTPYLLHPLRAALVLVNEAGLYTPQVVQIALLHDVLEARPELAPEMARRFCECVTLGVTQLSKPPQVTRSREEANRQYFARLVDATEAAKMAKLADKLDNVRDAVNCPDPSKRIRTVSEAEELFALLCPLLTDQALADAFARLLMRSVEELQHATGT